MKLPVWEGYKTQKCFKGRLFRFMDNMKIMGLGEQTHEEVWVEEEGFTWPIFISTRRRAEQERAWIVHRLREKRSEAKGYEEAVILVFRILPQLGVKVWERSKLWFSLLLPDKTHSIGQGVGSSLPIWMSGAPVAWWYVELWPLALWPVERSPVF